MVDAVITGIGIISALGDGLDAHWDALNAGTDTSNATSFAPYIIHPLVPVNFDTQIPKKGDQRQMEPWQRIGTYAAGLALESAGIKGNQDLLSRMDMIVAAGGGERDVPVDSAILSDLPNAANPDVMLNERMMSDLRPTLFLAQLSNLLAGNISIVHGVAGSSRTFMGEESAGVDAVRIAHARITSGQSERILVGGAANAERKDLILLYETGGFALRDTFKPVFDRKQNSGLALGSFGAFLVIESADAARARGASAFATLTSVAADRAGGQSDARQKAIAAMWQTLQPRKDAVIISGATGGQPATKDEQAFLQAHPDHPVRVPANRVGYGAEAQFPMNIALAALALKHGSLFASTGDALEKPANDPLLQVVVTSVGHWRGEGMAVLDAAQRS